MNDSPFIIPVNSHCHMRLPMHDDAEKLFRLIEGSRDSLRKWLPWLDNNTNIEDTHRFIKYCQERYTNLGIVSTIIMYQNKLAGCIGFNQVNRGDKNATVGYWLGEPFRGRGIMLNCCHRLIDYAFYDLSLHRIELRCAEGNEKSQNIALRLGFSYEGTLRDGECLYGEFHDLKIYSLLKPEWRLRPLAKSSLTKTTDILVP